MQTVDQQSETAAAPMEMFVPEMVEIPPACI